MLSRQCNLNTSAAPEAADSQQPGLALRGVSPDARMESGNLAKMACRCGPRGDERGAAGIDAQLQNSHFDSAHLSRWDAQHEHHSAHAPGTKPGPRGMRHVTAPPSSIATTRHFAGCERRRGAHRVPR